MTELDVINEKLEELMLFRWAMIHDGCYSEELEIGYQKQVQELFVERQIILYIQKYK